MLFISCYCLGYCLVMAFENQICQKIQKFNMSTLMYITCCYDVCGGFANMLFLQVGLEPGMPGKWRDSSP